MLNPYPAYKPSGVEWLGDVPTHWEAPKLKASVLNVIDQNPQDDKHEISLALEHVESWTGRYHDAGPNVSFDSQVKHFRVDDVLFGKLRPYLAKVVRPNKAGRCVSEFLVLRPRDYRLSASYLELLLRSKPVIDAVNSSTFGAKMPRTDWQFIGNMCQPSPSLSEQTAIVRYLGHIDERINRYISAKERIINLLEEQRQSVIHRGVTRGLDPNVRLKPSGVEWLGDVPAHWEVRRLRNVGEALIGLTYAPQDVVDEEDGILVLRASNISGGRIVYEDNVFVRCSVPSRLITRIGDILICSRSGSRTLIGKNARIDLASSGVTFGAFMTIFRSTNNDYLYYVFNSKLFEYQSGAYQTSTINQLTLNILYDIKIPLPSLAVQKQITQYLDRITSSIDTAINCARREIDLLKEYRTRLIADVVTGKLDVREAAFKLPEVPDELSFSDRPELQSG